MAAARVVLAVWAPRGALAAWVLRVGVRTKTEAPEGPGVLAGLVVEAATAAEALAESPWESTE